MSAPKVVVGRQLDDMERDIRSLSADGRNPIRSVHFIARSQKCPNVAPACRDVLMEHVARKKDGDINLKIVPHCTLPLH
jgi:hypothetical protein